MLIPLSWLKEYVEIKLPLKDLMWKMTEAGLTCEATKKIGDEITLDVEVTANRPDWMSIVGVAREVAAIQGVKIKEPNIKKLPTQTANFPIDLITNFDLFDRWTGIVIKGVEIKPSPKWLQDRITLMGHSPINNVIDITNYVMYELGIPMHAFDYDEIYGQIMTIQLSKGGEKFTSVDNLDYVLPKNAIVINDAERLIDLSGIKGGFNSGIKETTKNIFLHVTIDNAVLVRRTSQALGLRSDASAIYERGPDKGGTVSSLTRAVNLILDLAGGEVASKIMDLKKEKYEPENLFLSFDKLEKILGIKIPENETVQILSKLNLSPKKSKLGINCKVPSYRGDIKIEEDLIEEVARLYGYNKFPMTMPTGKVNNRQIPYYFDDNQMLYIKNLLVSCGYSETKSLSLISKDLINKFGMDPAKHYRIENPVSIEYEYMRTSLLPSLVSAIKINSADNLKLFEIDKVFLKTSKGAAEEYKVAGIFVGDNFRKFKGTLDLILSRLNIEMCSIEFEIDKPYLHQSNSGTIKLGNYIIGEFGEVNPIVLDSLELSQKVYCFEMDIETLKRLSKIRMFSPIPPNPAQIEDVTLVLPPKTRIGEVIKTIKNLQSVINNVELVDIYKDAYTFRIWYQDQKKSLTNEDVEKIRREILSSIKSKFGATMKA
jgi:phenylalanyl-tRNA synthetase beta chain